MEELHKKCKSCGRVQTITIAICDRCGSTDFISLDTQTIGDAVKEKEEVKKVEKPKEKVEDKKEEKSEKKEKEEKKKK